MKYIRTKDGKIIDFKPIKPKYENDVMTLNWLIDNYCGGKNNVVKVADTIEELCDEFVYCKGKKRKAFSPLTFTEKDISFCDVIYGAIWTEWGLKYVAKINEKGELELL